MRITFFLATVIASSIYSTSIRSQIGIQTDFPRTLFHIDGAKDNPQNSTSAITAAQQQNDIVIDSNGRLGVGTVSPEAKLDIEHSKDITGDDYGLKLTPGYGGPAILVLENDGQTVQWEANPSLGQYAQFQVQPTVLPYGSKQSVTMDKLDGSLALSGVDMIMIPTEGRYLLNLDMMGLTTLGSGFATYPFSVQASIYIYLYKYNASDGTIEQVDVIEHYMSITRVTGDYMAFSTALYAGYCYPNDYLFIVFSPVVGYESDGNYTITSDKPCIVTIYNI